MIIMFNHLLSPHIPFLPIKVFEILPLVINEYYFLDRVFVQFFYKLTSFISSYPQSYY